MNLKILPEIIASDMWVPGWFVAGFLGVMLLTVSLIFLIKRWPTLGLVVGVVNLVLGLMQVATNIENSQGTPVGDLEWFIAAVPLILSAISFFRWRRYAKKTN